MARKKTNKIIGVFKIFFKSLNTYFLYLNQTSKQLSFPILGQLFSIILIFTVTYLFNENYDSIKNSSSLFNEDKNILIAFITVLLPLFIILLKSIYDYIINFASLNLLFYTHSPKKTVKKIDFASNNAVIQRKIFKYIILMLLIGIIMSIPILGIFLSIFLALVFQVFALEGEITPVNSIKRSFELVKSNFIPVIILLVLCTALTYYYLPNLFIWVCEKTQIYYFIFNNCEKFTNIIPVEDYLSGILSKELINEIYSPLQLARLFTEGIISFIIIGYTLPFRCCCFTELYRISDSEQIKEFSKDTDEIIKRATDKKRKN